MDCPLDPQAPVRSAKLEQADQLAQRSLKKRVWDRVCWLADEAGIDCYRGEGSELGCGIACGCYAVALPENFGAELGEHLLDHVFLCGVQLCRGRGPCGLLHRSLWLTGVSVHDERYFLFDGEARGGCRYAWGRCLG
jgi:hypothetical protein